MEHYQVCPDIYIVENENSVPGKEFFVSKGSRNFYVSTVIAKLLTLLQSGQSVSSIIQELTSGYNIREEQVRFLLDKKLPELGLLTGTEQQEEKPEEFEQYIKFTLPVLTENFVVKASAILQYLYNPVVAGISILLSLFAFALLLSSDQFSFLSWDAIVAFPLIFTAEDYVWLYLVLITGYLLHELGHTSAGVRYGASIDEVGVGLYFIFPVFYSDMSKAWSLSIPKRTVVNVGGAYFQFLFAAGIAVYAAFTGSKIAVFAIYLIINSTIINLSPFLRFDGYWIFSDLFKIPNLRQSSKRLIGSVFTKNEQSFFKRVQRARSESPVLFYYALGSLSFVVFIAYVLFSFASEMVKAAPTLFVDFAEQYALADTFSEYSVVTSQVAYFIILSVAYVLIIQRLLKAVFGLFTPAKEAK